jgi:heterodisulfide reductase subunit C
MHVSTFQDEVEERSGVKVPSCYQCGKCSAGCPAAHAMDLLPHQIMRLIQLGKRDKVLASKAIWLCASCETCTTRCPQEVDIARTMDALRQIAYEEGRVSAQQDTVVFHEAFLNWVKRTGRQFEAGLVGEYKLRTGNVLQDLDAAPKMMGKLKKIPRRIKGQAAVARIFEKCKGK